MTTNLDILSMSDDEFSKLAPPTEEAEKPEAAALAEVQAPETATKETEEKPETQESVPDQENTQTPTDESVKTDEDGAGEAVDTEGETEPKPTAPAEQAEPATTPTPAAAPAEAKDEQPPAPEKKEDKVPPQENADAKPEAANYEQFYNQVMAPFKANGKMIQLQSADEAIALMQMGANYTKKMQSLQGHKKYLMMLENNNLLDENKLSFLIDLDKKNPEAIKKLLKESNIDPVDMDTSSEVNYKNGVHAVTDQEAALSSAIDEIKSLPSGQETIQSVNGWDNQSKRVLWENPELLRLIHSQHENGIYGHISAEIERRKVIGTVLPNAPFLQVYKAVGDELTARGAFKHLAKPATSAQPPVAGRTPVAVRPAKTPATKAVDNQKVRAAASTRSIPRQVKEAVNFLSMSDEEFSKLSSKV